MPINLLLLISGATDMYYILSKTGVVVCDTLGLERLDTSIQPPFREVIKDNPT